MITYGLKNPDANLSDLGLRNLQAQHWNLTPKDLTQLALDKGQGQLASSGALAIETGKYTGRSPKDRFIVKDSVTTESVDWGEINIPFKTEDFDGLHQKMITYLEDKEVYVRDCYACADPAYRLNIRLVAEYPWQNIFAYNMFLRLTEEEVITASPEWNIIAAPGFMANPETDGTRQKNFAVINFSKKMILIGGSAYTGEIKKGIFSVLNYVLPHDNNVLAMHCSSNKGDNGDTAVFFGLSGTGKTTLSADANRHLIGDDEHGWNDKGVFNFEGGCYAKTIDLTLESEPEIYGAIKEGALLENIQYFEGTNEVNYADTKITQNTRVSYPIYHIDNAADPSMGGIPKNIFFLTADAFGILPPISKLTKGQAMYHFISGYTAKVAGTEEGVVEPQTTFSACFGAPFLPLHPTYYAEMLGKKMDEHQTNVWLINTGWTGGPYGVGNRMKLAYTRAMITAALSGELNKVQFEQLPIFNLNVPSSCPNVPDEVLNPKNTWDNKNAYDQKANELAESFIRNFVQFEAKANEEIMEAAPVVRVEV